MRFLPKKDNPALTMVKDVNDMFFGASSFNQEIDSWDVSNVTYMVSTFRRAREFSQDAGNWDIPNVTNMSNMLFYSGLSMENYDKFLEGLAGHSVHLNVSLGARG